MIHILFLIIISLILSSYALIVHQLMTINGMFIFFIICHNYAPAPMTPIDLPAFLLIYSSAYLIPFPL